MNGSSTSGAIVYDWPGHGCDDAVRLSKNPGFGTDTYDVAIVGAGVVGCALAYTLSRYRLRLLLVDRMFDVGEGSSKGNSAIVHTGFDAPPGSLESELVTKASRMWPQLAQRLKIPFDQTGAVMLAIDDEQAALLPKIHKKALDNGVDDVRLLSAAEARAIEPCAAATIRGGLLVPRESIADPFATSIAYAEVALSNGADILLGAEVQVAADPGAPVKMLQTASGKVLKARVVVNAAGLGGRGFADGYGGAPFSLNPRRGQFAIFDKSARKNVKRILLPIPTQKTKGILVMPTIFGNLIAGPTAEDLPLGSPEISLTTPEGMKAVIDGAALLYPGLMRNPVIGNYSGSRCNCAEGSYIIRPNDGSPGFLSVIGIRSTGFTSSPALAGRLEKVLAEEMGVVLERDPAAVDSRPEGAWPAWWKRPFDDPEMMRRNPDCAKMICVCENVTKAGIEDAIDSPLRPRTLDAIKRRTRSQTGRCQGFECTVKIARILSERLGLPLSGVTKKGPGSWLLPEAGFGEGEPAEATPHE